MSSAAAKSLFGFFAITPILVAPDKPTFSTSVPSDRSNAATVSNLVRAGKLDEALQHAQKIKDVSLKNEALSEIASAYRSAGQLNQAFQVAKSITQPQQPNDISLKDNVLSEIVKAYTQAGQLDQALQVAEIMGEVFKFTTLLDIAEKYRVAGQSVRAASIIERADAVYRTASKPDSTNLLASRLKLFILPRFIGQYLAVGRKQRADELSSELFEFVKTLPQQDYMTISILSSIAQVYEGAGQRDKAVEVLDYSLSAAKNIKETFVKAQALAQIANQYALLKQSARATEVLSQAIALAKPDKEVSSKNIVIITVARGYGVLGQYDKALEITKAVEPASLRDKVKQTLACSLKRLESL
ncbi:tetratricopeptide repeat protein [Tolypothrix sp. VBCCA 56010]|uniref:tetratricopeptide repeat protein n=1 Tax=Tolypothrix sp. VBCCA 56010 TaxID=3137731 RepID=UPI003D7CEC97